MKNFILTRILGLIGSKLDGYKTKIGGVGGIILGVLGIVKLIFPTELPQLPDLGIEASLAAISAGFVALGIGGKLEKQTKAITAATPLLPPLSGGIETSGEGVAPGVSPKDGGQ